MTRLSAIAVPLYASLGCKTRTRQTIFPDCKIKAANESRSGFFRRRLDRPAGFLPGAEPAFDMGDRLESHILRGLRRQRRAEAAGAEEHVFLVLREKRLVIGARRVQPEFQHAARAMEGARHLAVALQFAHVPDIDQHDVAAPGKPDR